MSSFSIQSTTFFNDLHWQFLPTITVPNFRMKVKIDVMFFFNGELPKTIVTKFDWNSEKKYIRVTKRKVLKSC
jgi:phage FluMu gp28-like protein